MSAQGLERQTRNYLNNNVPQIQEHGGHFEIEDVNEETGEDVVKDALSSVSVPTVARQMAAEDVKKVPVVDDVDLVGIVTLTDIVWEFTSLRREATELAAAREKWSPG